MNIYITLKKTVQTLFILSLFLLLSSCEELINIDLNSADPKIVIEGTVTDQPGPYRVTITKTTDYYNPGTYPTVIGAEVTITDDLGFSEELQEIENGVYQTINLQGVSDRIYTLTVIAEGQTYSAVSSMPQPTEIDSLYYEKGEGGPRQKDKEGYNLIVVFRDEPGVEDFKRIKVFRNGILQSGYFLYNGRLSDGNVIEYNRIRTDFELGDFVSIELLSIDKATYEYYSTLGNAAASASVSKIQTKIPANPNSNLTGDALGYFGAFTVRPDSILIE